MGDVKVKVELTIKVNDQIENPQSEPDFHEQFKFEDGCDCTMPQLHTWIAHQKKLVDSYIDGEFKKKYGD